MAFALPPYHPPDFTASRLAQAPVARFVAVERDGVAPAEYHATSVFPEYLQLAPGDWRLLKESRMDCVVRLGAAEDLEVVEFRRLCRGDRVALGRREDGGDGILVHTSGFRAAARRAEKFAFRTLTTRETSFSYDYDELYALLGHERHQGFVLWVLGPALAFDRDARAAFVRLVRAGFVHGVLAGNALPTHDLEAALHGTALGQEIYRKRPVAEGHYKHLDTLNSLRALGSVEAAVARGLVCEGIVHALVQNHIPYVFAGSIRDDGPLPGVIADACAAQDAMRALARRATTVICLATQLHTIATGNLTPSYQVLADGRVRPVYFYSVDMSEFAAQKLINRGSLTTRAILTNAQDFVVTLERGLTTS
ncbi:hypothetical protein [Geoalkalibacter halelectricus]|uniref:Arginine dihydrolase ArgZ/ArgE-like C-terminal second subdomain domain-containing protein n=1 Tax=Geoalkalibacter halelectricus TaxID=2847045 RepID=A0ABY5ZJH8_9BACT|nr:hypothetical protein [Geoalkalibacter halelectricus]MDO3377793.1 hypothetical protein [Geoalkalibacter halelectricus]UWZ78614.1 hypothetical protein L9S41_13110 [Geoalkalibacter halelectricus]